MNRILLVLSLFLLASAAAASSRATDDAEVNCPKPGGRSIAAPVVAPANQTPANAASHIIPNNHAHNTAAPRVISPRWHSFLPGMFR
jgi:hypothetical protein